MREVICDTSTIQYLYQVGQLPLLQRLATRITVPPAVVSEIEVGRLIGIELPDLNTLSWVNVKAPMETAVLASVTELGPGETQVLALTLETQDAVAILDDALARRIARALKVPVKGTLGILLDAKRAGLISTVTPILDQLDTCGFRLSRSTRTAVIALAGEDFSG